MLQEPQIKGNLLAIWAISDDKDTTWYIRCCSGGIVSVSKWEEARQRLLVLSDTGNSGDKIFASNEAKWLHHNRKPVPPTYNNSQIKILLSSPHRVSTRSDHRQEVTFRTQASKSYLSLRQCTSHSEWNTATPVITNPWSAGLIYAARDSFRSYLTDASLQEWRTSFWAIWWASHK